MKSSDSSILQRVTAGTASKVLKPAPSALPQVVARQSEELRLLQQDLDIARKIQEKLLPDKAPDIRGYDFGTYYSPAGAVGGDFYDFIQFDSNTLGVMIADASGKGLSGSLLMVEARAVIRSMASISKSPKEVLQKANRVLHHDFRRGMFITMFFARIELSKGILRVASAGHMPMLLWRKRTRKCYAVNPTGLVLGVAPDKMFKETLQEHTLELQPGDRFVLYTDGVTELMNRNEDEYGRGALVHQTVKKGHLASSKYVNAVVNKLEEHRSGFKQSDDITIVTGRTLPEDQLLDEQDDETPLPGNRKPEQ